MRGLFITGTDTGVGKTYVACAIIRACVEAGIHVGACKPVCTGSEATAAGNRIWPDAEALRSALAERWPLERICPQCFHAPLAPPSAAALEGRRVDGSLLREGVIAWRNAADLLVIEGVGGLLCPLTGRTTVVDFAAELGYPLVIVAALKLGCISHTLMTIEVARAHRLPIAGVILNHIQSDDGSAASSIAEITVRSPVPVVGILPFDPTNGLRPPDVIRRIDWKGLASLGGLTAPP